MKGIKIMLEGISVLLLLTIWIIGTLIGGGKGAETTMWSAFVPLALVTYGLFKKD